MSNNSTRRPIDDMKFLHVNKRQRMDKPETQATVGHQTQNGKKHNTEN